MQKLILKGIFLGFLLTLMITFCDYVYTVEGNDKTQTENFFEVMEKSYGDYGKDSIINIMWYPWQYWDKMAYPKNAQQKEYVQKLKKGEYLIFSVLDVKANKLFKDDKFPEYNPMPKNYILSKIRLLDNKGKKYKPMKESKIEEVFHKEIKYVIRMGMPGKLSKGFYFITFDNAKKSNPIIDIKKIGKLDIKYKNINFSWKLPFNASLLESKEMTTYFDIEEKKKSYKELRDSLKEYMEFIIETFDKELKEE